MKATKHRFVPAGRRKLLTLAVASCFASELACANPTGAAVAHGQAAISTQGNVLTVTNTPGTVINWQGFSIASQDITRFLQQSAASTVLNRVVGVNPSTILGQIQSNGRVFLVNPSGIVIGQGATIDVAGFLASTLNLSDADFIAGRYRFGPAAGTGSVVNQGTITTPSGGTVYLVGQNVENHGIIKSPQGEILLAAGKSIELVDAGTPGLRVQITAPDNQALNLGQLLASGGRIGMYGGLVRHGGVANANTAVAGENGKILLKAIKDVNIEAGSVTTASGPSGGSITVQAETGTLLASGTIEANGDAGKGGTVQLLGTQVGLTGNASVDASGQTGGGTVLVGGDFQGKNPDVQNAFRTYFGPDAAIKADAITSGDGGKVIIWADDVTRAYGSIGARGGSQSGNGGFVEVSGKGQLDFAAGVDASAPNGRPGTLLLDPTNITVATGGGSAVTAVDAFADPGGTLTLSPATLNAAGTTVVLQATDDIMISSAVDLTTASAGFVAQAGRDITVNAPITTNGGRIHLEADSPHSPSPGEPNGSGRLSINAAVSSNGGHITLIGGGDPIQSGGGIIDLGGIVNAGSGGINIALSGNAPLGVGTLGVVTQILGIPMDNLRTTGALVVGTATTAGSNGLGASPETLLASSISNFVRGSAMNLSPQSGSSFELVAGDGGILLDKPLTTFQPATINTTGTLTINEPVNTSNNSLTLSAPSVTVGSNGSISTGGGSCYGTGCPTISWTGATGPTPGDGVNWFNALNWSGDSIPGSTNDVTVGAGFGTIVVNGAGQAKSLVASSPLQLSSGQSLTLTNTSNFSNVIVSGGTATFNGGASAGTLALSSGAVNGSGFLAVTSDFNQTGGSLAGTFSNLALTKSGNFTVGSFQATSSISLTAAGGALLDGNGATVNVATPTATLTAANGIDLDTAVATLTTGNTATGNTAIRNTGSSLAVSGMSNAGVGAILLTNTDRITLNGTVSASGGSGNQIVLAGTGFTNNAGSGALNPGGGRWLVYSTNPAGNTFGPGGNLLSSGNQAIWGRSYPAAVSETGNRYVFSDTGFVTVTTTNASKTYGQTADVSSSYSLSGTPVAGAATYGNVFDNVGVTEVFAAGPAIGSAGSAATASVAGGPYSITGTGTANAGYSLAFVSTGLLTVNKADYTAISGTKTYDGSASFTSGQVTLTGVNNETFTVASATANSANASANSGAATFVSAGAVTGGGNYNALNLGALTTNTATINRATINLAGSRDYDGTTTFAAGAFGSAGTISGVNGETLTLSGTGSVGSAKVSAGAQLLNPGSLTLGNGTTGLASNYQIAASNNTGTITASATVPFAWDLTTASDLRWENPANWNQGAIPMNGATASIPGGLSGPVVYSGVSGVTGLRTLSSGSGFTITGGMLTLGNSTADVSTFSGRPLTLNGGTLNGAGAISLTGTTLNVLAGGVLGGSRIINGDVFNFAGTVSPGASPGIMTINGNYLQGPQGALLAEIGGTVVGAQYDQLFVTGAVTLGGNLNVMLVDGFVPAAGNVFRVVQSSSVSGTFASAPTASSAFAPTAPPLTTHYLASSVDVTAGNTVTAADSLVNALISQTNNAPPVNNSSLNTTNMFGSSGQNSSGAYLETVGGQLVPLTDTTGVRSGLYTNVDTGQTTIFTANSNPEPGVYISEDGNTVVVVTKDETTNQTTTMVGSTSGGKTTLANAKVSKPVVCK